MYEHIWEEQGIVRRFFEEVTGQEIAQSAIEAQADSRFDRLHYVINDFRDCEGISVVTKTIQEIAAQDSGAAATNWNIRIAVISDNPEVLAISDAYTKEGLSPYPVRNFATMQDARMWLSDCK